MTRAQSAIAILSLFVGGMLGGSLASRPRPVHAAGPVAAPRVTVRPETGPTAAPPTKQYFTSSMMMGVMDGDKGYVQRPALVVWRYGPPAGAPQSAATAQPSLQLVRMMKSMQRAALGKPTDWEYVLLQSPDSDEVFLFRYRVYEPPTGEPIAEYSYLGRESPSYSGFGKPGMPE